MRLIQLDDTKIVVENKSNLSNDETINTLKAIMHDLHKTLLVADTLMRKLDGIIEKS